MAQNGVQAPEPGILARLTSTITVEDAGYGRIQLWREASSWGGSREVCITLRADAEDKLLALLLERKGITLNSNL